MTYLVERLGELRRHLTHLEQLRARVTSADDLRGDFSLRNDVLFSLLMVAQLVVDIAGELSARRALPFDDYTTAVRNLLTVGVEPAVVTELEALPGLRNVVLHEYVGLDLERVVEATRRLEPVQRFVRTVAELEASDADSP
ncbi:DUF86 domain-containing protein [Egibacter rhizosphaerae]|uniref:DUF86 domain-containing protein n=1 Tax=Egibacter rhizosphaerae TaxID=1670831 RepID=A0A411YEP8_9ACTN|nr:HepT-like ribonuclease domain-containing protein [Egibacter rhizosphaerae]QBI19734.1 DUF86 domain-containing protein [Egibacter rhizosphaerae]